VNVKTKLWKNRLRQLGEWKWILQTSHKHTV